MFFTDIKINVDCCHFVVLKAVESDVQLILHFGQVYHTVKPVLYILLVAIVGLHLFIWH